MSDDDLLTIAQWLSPAFPIGSFAYSHGLETAIAEGHVKDGPSAQAWIATVLLHGTGRLDAAFVVAAMAADPPSLRALGAEAEATASSTERLMEMREQGRAFGQTVSALTGRDLPELPLPVAVGAAAAGLALAPRLVAAQYLQAFAATMVSAAVRTVPLGQTEGQRILSALRPAVLSTAEAATRAGPEALGTAAFGSDLAAMAHERQHVRLYKS